MEKMRVEEDRRPRKFGVMTFQMWQFCTGAYSFENAKHAQIISSIPLRLHKRQCKGTKVGGKFEKGDREGSEEFQIPCE